MIKTTNNWSSFRNVVDQETQSMFDRPEPSNDAPGHPVGHGYTGLKERL